jgi:hypothetical protein
MPDTTGKETGKILFFDPNNVTIKGDPGDNLTAIFNGLEIFKDPEDYSIAVDLEVTTKSRNNVTTNDQKMTYSMEKTSGVSSFFQGKTMGNENTLSTFFTDTTYDGNDPEAISEAMCISSIEIEFSAWYVASVIIKFTDVRGASLFSPTEYLSRKNSNTNNKISNGDLFSGFFSMPYPIFKLKIKGFYGDAVTYPLHCQDFNAAFNAETGNFDVTVQFIGYTYAMLSDIQMTYLIAAPYCEVYGSSYWDTQVNNGRFLTLEGNPLPKIPDLMTKINNGEYVKSKLNASNNVFKSAETLESKSTSLTEIKKLIDSYVGQLSSNYDVTKGSDIYNLTSISTTKKTLTETLSNDTTAGPYIQKLFIYINKYINTFTDDSLFTKYKGELARTYFQIKNVSKTSNTTTGNLDLTEMVNKIELYQKDNANEKKDLGDKVSSTVKNTLSETYQMIPSIYNFTKLLIAHMETLLHCVAACANDASKDEKNRGYATSGQGTDIKGNKFSPFPWFTINDSGKDRDEWIGIYHPDFSEVKLVKALIKARTEVTAEIEKLETAIPTSNIAKTDTTISIGKIWYPINAFDNSISTIGNKMSTKPYENLIKENGVDANELKAILSTRIAIMAGLSGSLNQDNYNSLIIGESKNIIDQLGTNTDHLAKVITALTGIKTYSSESNKKTGTTLKFFPYNGNMTGYEYNLLDTGVLPLTDSSLATFKKEIKNSNNVISGNYYRDGSTTNKNPIELNILSGVANCDMIYKDWYLMVSNNIGTNDKLSGILSRYLLTKETSVIDVSNTNYTMQPLMNRIAYNRPSVSSSDNTLKTLFSNYGFYTGGDFSKKPNIYKLYTGKDNETQISVSKIEELNRGTIFAKGKADINTFTYPMIGGNIALYKNTSVWYRNLFGLGDKVEIDIVSITSLFGNPVYYAQNEMSEKEARRAKSFLFLQTLPVNIKSLNNLFTSKELTRSFMIRMPKAEALLLGSMLWRRKNGNSVIHNGGMVTIPDTSRYFREARKNVYYNNFKLSNEENDTFERCGILDYIETSSITATKLIGFFESWSDDNSNADGWLKIQSALEIESKNNVYFTKHSFTQFAKGFYNSTNKTKYIKDHASSNVINNYISFPQNEYLINLINVDKTDGVKAVISLLFDECILSYTGKGKLSSTKFNRKVSVNDTTLTQSNVNFIVNGLITKMEAQKKILNTVTDKINVDTNVSVDSLEISEEENANLQTYKYLKVLYDKWVSGYEFNTENSEYKWISSKNMTTVSGFKTYDIINFKFIDRSYTDIGNKFIINFKDIFDNLIGYNEQKTLYSTLTDVLSKNNFLFLPMPNYESWNNSTDFAKIFQPLSYTNSRMSDGNDDWTSIFVCIYTGSLSKNLNIESDNYEYQDDALNLNIDQNEDIPEDFTSNIEAIETSESQSMGKVPVFAVSYGKQNQSYFKSISLSQNNPVVTDASILSIKNLNDKNDTSSKVTTMSQDMYSVYSNYSYTCQVEMLGCPQIQPMMYFQLTNCPMWNGAYLIFKVSHSIKAGSMITTFIGMRMPKNYPLLVSPTVVSSDPMSLGVVSVTPKSNKISTLSFNTKIGKYFTLAQYTTTDYGVGTAHVSEVPEYIVSRFQNNLAPTIDYIYDTWIASELNKGYGNFRITSGYRPNSTGSQHSQGLAADLQLIKASTDGNNALFAHIKQKMKNGLKMDQLIREPSSKGGWCHVSPVYTDNSIVKIRGMALVFDSNRKTIVDQSEIIEEATGTGKISNPLSVSNKWLDYWKKAENSKSSTGGWNSSEQKWYAHVSVEGGLYPTIAYGIVLAPGTMKSDSMSLMNITQLQNGTLGITDENAIEEIVSRANLALKRIEKIVNSYKQSSFSSIEEKYKYALVDIYMNTGEANFKKYKNCIQAAINNDLEGVIREGKRNGLPRRNALYEKYLRNS